MRRTILIQIALLTHLGGCFEDSGPIEGTAVTEGTQTDPWTEDGSSEPDGTSSPEDPDSTSEDGLTGEESGTDDTWEPTDSDGSGETSGPETGTTDSATSADETTESPDTTSGDTTGPHPVYTPCVTDADCGGGEFCTPLSGNTGHCTVRCDCATSNILSCDSNNCPANPGGVSPYCHHPYVDGQAKGGHCWLFVQGTCESSGLVCPEGLVCVDYVGGDASGKALCRAP